MTTITPEEIRTIPERYAIGKRPLSLLLGWGELTYTRLLDGNTPTQQHAAELRTLVDDPAAFARLLETGRGRITDTAYVRSFQAVDELLADEGGAANATKIYAVADRLCVLAEGDLTPSALQRLVYYAQGTGFAKLGKPLFADLPRAAAEGPAYDRIARFYTFDEIQRVSDVAAGVQRSSLWDNKAARDGFAYNLTAAGVDVLTSAETKVVNAAYEKYGSYSGQALSRMSRGEAPWKKARKRAGVADDRDCDELLSAKSMTKFFGKKR